MKRVLKKKYDTIIIGAGITGCLLARQLSLYDLDIAVFEKSSYVCSGQSKANGAIVHAGHNEKPGSMKARLCVEGNRMFPDLCSRLGVFFKKTGYVVLAFDDRDEQILRKLQEQSIANGVHVEIISQAKLASLEPNASKDAISALWVKDAGYTDIHRLVIAAAEHAAVNGVDFIFNTEIKDLLWDEKNPSAITGVTDGIINYHAGLVINCAGVDADRLINKAGDKDFRIVPRKGEYYIIDKAEGDIVNGAVYPLPSPFGKGCAIIPTCHGNTIFGGNSIEISDREDLSNTREDMEDVIRQSCRLVPAVKDKKVISAFSGIRSSVKGKDFLIGEMKGVKGLINVAGIDSPGLTSSPAIAVYVRDLIGDKYFDLAPDRSKKEEYMIRPLFRDLGSREQGAWIKEDPRFGRIICRCENITEGDVAAAINSPIPTETADAVKFKTWVGAGRCQGSFDLPRLLSILSREFDIEASKILKRGPGSNIVMGDSRIIKGRNS